MATLADVRDQLVIANVLLDEIKILLQQTQPPPRPLVTTLIQEFFGREDLDFGGGAGNSIYGTASGFQLDEADPDFPPTLESVHSHPRFEFPATILTFQEYQDTL